MLCTACPHQIHDTAIAGDVLYILYKHLHTSEFIIDKSTDLQTFTHLELRDGMSISSIFSYNDGVGVCGSINGSAIVIFHSNNGDEFELLINDWYVFINGCIGQDGYIWLTGISKNKNQRVMLLLEKDKSKGLVLVRIDNCEKIERIISLRKDYVLTIEKTAAGYSLSRWNHDKLMWSKIPNDANVRYNQLRDVAIDQYGSICTVGDGPSKKGSMIRHGVWTKWSATGTVLYEVMITYKSGHRMLRCYWLDKDTAVAFGRGVHGDGILNIITNGGRDIRTYIIPWTEHEIIHFTDMVPYRNNQFLLSGYTNPGFPVIMHAYIDNGQIMTDNILKNVWCKLDS